MKLSKRLSSIANLIDNNSSIIDIGCDHGLLDIYLAKEKGCYCIASDISEKCIDKTNLNINKYNASNIITIVSDGLMNIKVDNNDIIIISGMGTSTIKNIIDKEINNNLIIQSNNEHEELRKYLYSINYHIIDEEVVYDKGKYYITMYLKKGLLDIDAEDLFIGPLLKTKKSSIDYYKYLYSKYCRIIDELPNNNSQIDVFKERIKIIEKTLDQLDH